MERAAKHSVFVIAAFLATSVLNYALGVGLSWFLSPTYFGVLGVAQSLLLLLALVVSAGFSWTANHDLASGGISTETRGRFRAAWLANVFLGLAVAGAVWLAYRTGVLDLGPSYRLVVPLVGLTAVLLAARAVVAGAAQGMYRFGPVAINQVAEVVVKFAAGIGLVALGFGVAGVMAAFAAGAALALLHSLWIVRDARLWQGKGWFNRDVMVVTAPMFIGMLGPALMLNLDILGLKLLAPVGRGDELAGFYQAAVILARIPIFTARSLTMVVFSYVAGASRQSNPPDYARAAARLWQRLLLPAGLALALAPQAALAIFFPPAYASAMPALRVAAIGGILLALVTLLTGIAQAAGKRRASALAAGAATLVQVAVLFWLVPRWGILGAAASLVAAGIVALAGLAPLFAPRRVPAPATLWRHVWPLLALAVPLLLLPDGTRLLGLLKVTTAGLTYLVALAAAQGFLSGPARTAEASGSTALPLMARLVDVLIGG